MLTSISPTTLPAGATNQAVTINGSGFAANFVTGGGTVDFGDGVTVLSLTRNSNTRLTARVTVSPSAVPGPRNVQVNAPGGLSTSLQGAFTVAAGPTITSLNPASMRRTGTTQTLMVTGSRLCHRCEGHVLGHRYHGELDDVQQRRRNSPSGSRSRARPRPGCGT